MWSTLLGTPDLGWVTHHPYLQFGDPLHCLNGSIPPLSAGWRYPRCEQTIVPSVILRMWAVISWFTHSIDRLEGNSVVRAVPSLSSTVNHVRCEPNLAHFRVFDKESKEATRF